MQRCHNGHVCPICGRRYKSLVAHLQRMSEACEKHRILYALMTTASHARDRVRQLRDWVCEVLEVEA